VAPCFQNGGQPPAGLKDFQNGKEWTSNLIDLVEGSFGNIATQLGTPSTCSAAGIASTSTQLPYRCCYDVR
jgi:hypothetical protein